jgi:fatty-acyl-CoA synthase
MNELLATTLELAGISRRFLAQSRIHEDLRPRAIAALVRQVRRGLRGHMIVIRLHALSAPDRPAIITPDIRLSYGEMDRRVIRLAHGLHRLGVSPGDRVGLLLDNGHEFIEASFALSYLGATAVQIGYRLKAKEVAYILSHSGARALLFHEAHEEVARAAVAEVGAAPPICIVAGARRPGLLSYEELTQSGPSDEPPFPKDGGYGSQMLYTSGTTGKSKGARRDLKETSLLPVIAMLSEMPIGRDDRHLCVCPLYHAAAPAFCNMVFALGGCVIIPRHFVAEEIPGWIARERVTSSVMVPTMLNRLLTLPREALGDTSSLRWIMSVAAPLPTDLARRVEDRLGPVLFNMYGSTETGVVTLARPGEHTARPGTIGRRIFGNDIRLLDESGREVPVGQVGELYVKNRTLVVGYHKDPQATDKAMRDGYFTVGDMGYRDADGFYYLADRKSDMVISAGVNIYPLEIEQRLHEHPDVADCAVLGVPDAEWGEALVAFISLNDGVSPSPEKAAELRAFVGQALADYKRPKRVEFIDAIPRNPTGKILKRELRQRAAALS